MIAKKEYVQLINRLNALIANKILEVKEMQCLKAELRHNEDNAGKVKDYTVKIIEKEDEVNRVIDLYVSLKQEIVGQLEKLPYEEYCVLYKFCVQAKSLKEISDDLVYSVSNIKLIKRRAFDRLEIKQSNTLIQALELFEISKHT